MPVPSVPTGLSGVTTIGLNAVTWNLVGGAMSYNIYVGGVLYHSNVSHPYDDVCNTALIFSYTVTAVNGSGESAQSTPWVSTIAQPQTPGAFTGITTFQDNYTTWSAVTADHYNIYANGGIIANDITDLFYDFSGVNTAYAYTYTVTAVINNVESIPRGMGFLNSLGARSKCCGRSSISPGWGDVRGISYTKRFSGSIHSGGTVEY